MVARSVMGDIMQAWDPVTKQYVSVQADSEGRLAVDVEFTAPEGGATEAQQIAQTNLLTTIAAATDVPLSDVVDAINELGNGATVAQVVALLTTDATTQTNILAKLTSIGVDVGASLTALLAIQTSVAAIDGHVDGLEASATAANAKLDTINTTLGTPLQAGGNVVVTSGSVTATISGTPTVNVGNFPASSNVVVTGSALPSGAATAALQGGGLPSALVADRLKVDGSGVTQPISDAGGSITVDGTVAATVSDGSGPLTVDGTTTANIGTTGGLALDNTLTGGSQIAVAKGPIAIGAAVGAEKPVLFGGTDGTNAQMANIDSTGAIRLQSGGTPGATAPTRATQIGGTDGTNLRAIKTDTAGHVATVAAATTWSADGATLPAAGTSFVISSTPCKLRRIEWDYTGAGTKYIAICDQAGGTANAANWTHWYRPITNGANLSYWEFPEGLTCSLGCVVGVIATEPLAGVAVVMSSNVAENFVLASYSFDPVI